MARIIIVTPVKILDMYANGEGKEWLNVKVGTEQRIYCRLEHQYPCLENEPFIVVYAVMP